MTTMHVKKSRLRKFQVIASKFYKCCPLIGSASLSWLGLRVGCDPKVEGSRQKTSESRNSISNVGCSELDPACHTRRAQDGHALSGCVLPRFDEWSNLRL